MPKKDQQQQPALLGPYDVTGQAAGGFVTPEGKTRVCVDKTNGPDAYNVREETASGFVSYRTEQRIDLATRLDLPADYDPAELVGRTFLVPA